MKRDVAQLWPGLSHLASWFHQDAKIVWGGFEGTIHAFKRGVNAGTLAAVLNDFQRIRSEEKNDSELRQLWRDVGGEYWPRGKEFENGLREIEAMLHEDID